MQFGAFLRARVYPLRLTPIMPREIKGAGAMWSCAQAYAGLEELHSSRPDASEQDGLVWVVATPDGGAQSVRLHLPRDWESMSDDELLNKIEQGASG